MSRAVVERSEKNAFVASDEGFLSNGKATEKGQFIHHQTCPRVLSKKSGLKLSYSGVLEAD